MRRAMAAAIPLVPHKPPGSRRAKTAPTTSTHRPARAEWRPPSHAASRARSTPKEAPMEDQERHINLHATPEMMAGVYANFANVSHSDYEFSITFVRLDHESEEPGELNGVVVSRVNLSARFLKELLDAMADNYSKWQAAENIRDLPEAPGRD